MWGFAPLHSECSSDELPDNMSAIKTVLYPTTWRCNAQSSSLSEKSRQLVKENASDQMCDAPHPRVPRTVRISHRKLT